MRYNGVRLGDKLCVERERGARPLVSLDTTPLPSTSSLSSGSHSGSVFALLSDHIPGFLGLCAVNIAFYQLDIGAETLNGNHININIIIFGVTQLSLMLTGNV